MTRPVRHVIASAAALAALAGCRPAPAGPALSDLALDRAIGYLDSLLARDPGNPIVAAQIAGRLVLRFGRSADLRDLERAEGLAVTAQRLARDTAAATARVAGIRLMRHDFSGALQAAREAVAANPASSDAQGILLEAALAAGDTLAASEAAHRLDRRSAEGRIRYGLWLDARGHGEAALRQLNAACSALDRSGGLADGVAWCWTQHANLVRAQRGAGPARALYRDVLARFPGTRGAAEGLAAIAVAEGDLGGAARLLGPLLSDAHPDLYLRLAEIRRKEGDREEAASLTDRFLRAVTAPDAEPLFGNLLALHYLESADPALRDSALALARRDVARRPTADTWDLLGWVLLARGDWVGALAASDRAVALGPLSPAAGYHRARILEASARPIEAAELLAAARARLDLLPPDLLRDLARRERAPTAAAGEGG
ncbi:MAG: hypothetical protein JNJ80_10000 [Gemmatimonadetes bacterium]|nr:hypothetical protein [Gemmatimonadota bacterium]